MQLYPYLTSVQIKSFYSRQKWNQKSWFACNFYALSRIVCTESFFKNSNVSWIFIRWANLVSHLFELKTSLFNIQNQFMASTCFWCKITFSGQFVTFCCKLSVIQSKCLRHVLHIQSWLSTILSKINFFARNHSLLVCGNMQQRNEKTSKPASDQ